MYRYSLDMARALQDMGHSLSFVGRRREPGLPEHVPEDWELLPYRSPSMLRRVVGLLPAKVIEIWDGDFETAVAEKLLTFQPDVVLFDHLRVGAALDVIDGEVPTIYLSQNDETVVKEKMVASTSGIRRAALWADLWKIRRFEDRLLRECAATSAISTADIESFASRHPNARQVHTLPVYRGTRRADRAIDASVPRRVGLITTLFWGAKIDNLAMALEGLSPLVADGVEVVVFTGGYMPPQEFRDAYPTVTFQGFVEDFDQALSECRLGLVYEPVGGGFKMKTLDFIYHRVPLVVGKGSAESLPLTPGNNVIEVEIHTDLAATLAPLIDDFAELNRLQESAFAECKAHFTKEGVRPLSDAINDIAG